MTTTTIEIFGTPGAFSGHYHDDGYHNGYTLKECPFCGGDELAIVNTHTAIFWIECECGAQMHGAYNEDAGKTQTEEAARAAFEAAMCDAVNDWNTRNG